MPYKTLLALLIVVAFLIGADYLAAQWTTPSALPPGNNVAAPINTSFATQIKSGGLGIGALDVAGGAIVRGTALTTDLDLRVNGRMGATEYCDASGLNCVPAGSGGGSSVSLTGGAGITLSPATITGVGTISANTTYLQRRITGVCPVGQAIRAVNADGTVVCQASAATCLWKAQTYSQGARCRTGSLTCTVSGSSGYTYQTCGADGTWQSGSTGCSLSPGSLTSCP